MSKPDTKTSPTKPYGYVLILRGLARAAIMLKDNPASLRVLCIIAEYMNQDGECRIGQGTVAARLGMSRQAANRHITILQNMWILDGEAKSDGVTIKYTLVTDGLEDERAGQDRVDERRARKRSEKDHSPPPPPEPDEARPPIAVVAGTDTVTDNAWMVGCTAQHQKFGSGIISEVDGQKITVDFDCGTKKVVAAFLTAIKAPKRATSEVAGGAI